MDVDGYADPYLASLYDVECPWHPSDDFYLDLVLGATDVLDVGCGTGVVLGAAAARGHRGRLVGLEPAEAMLARARRHAGVDWVRGTLRRGRWSAEFDLVTMTGHAFQELRSEADLRGFLAAAHDALRPGGRLAFETRNPSRRAWAHWHGQTDELMDPSGRTVRLRREVLDVTSDPLGELVTFTETYDREDLREPLVSRSTLRFVPVIRVDELLADAGFGVDDRYGDWDRGAFTDGSPEIVTVASA